MLNFCFPDDYTEHFLICLLFIFIFSYLFLKGLLKFFAYLTGFFVFLQSICRSSVKVLDTIFVKYEICQIFPVYNGTFWGTKMILKNSTFVNFMVTALCVCVRNWFSLQGCENIPLYFLLEALWSGVHILVLTQVGFVCGIR